MILTGKALSDFEAYYYSKPDHVGAWELLPIIHLHAIIVEWLDSVGIHVCITPIFKGTQIENSLYGYSYNIGIKSFTNRYTTRPEATEAALITANKIYNERN